MQAPPRSEAYERSPPPATALDIGAYEFPGDPTGVGQPGQDLAGLFLTIDRAAGQVDFSYRLPSDATVSLGVFDLRGRRLRVLASGRLPAGEHHAAWDGTDAGGHRVASGVYLARLRADATDLIRRFIVLR